MIGPRCSQRGWRRLETLRVSTATINKGATADFKLAAGGVNIIF
jgi:hypothetical protein